MRAVTVSEVNTGLVSPHALEANGYFTLPVLPVGHYDLEVQATGFRAYRRKGIVLDTNAALTLDATLEVGSATETVSVNDDALHVETVEHAIGPGDHRTGRWRLFHWMAAASLTCSRCKPGVAPATSISSSTVQDVGATTLAPSGTLNPGTISVNGQREFANYFSVNGSDVEEDVNAGTAIIPNLDAIAEFRIITSNFDAEYGEFSGGQISVVTKSGSNRFHGSAFDFLRNTDLDARNYFSPTRGAFRQNQYGGTLGGPIRRDKVFLFADYQGTRQTQGIDTGRDRVPSLAERAGELYGSVHRLEPTCRMRERTVSRGLAYCGNLATQVCQRTIPILRSPPDARSGDQRSFLTRIIPQERVVRAGAEDAAIHSRSEHCQWILDLRLQPDCSRRQGRPAPGWKYPLWAAVAYYFIDGFSLDNPYPVAQSGASVPGFDALTTGRAQLLALGDTKT